MVFILPNVAPFIPYADREQIAFAGDSLTVGNQSAEYGGYRHILLSLLSDFYDGVMPNVLGAGYSGSYSYPVIGASGITSSTLKTTVESELAAIPSLTMPIAPSKVFLLIGINDILSSGSKSTWLSNVTSIISSFRNANTDCDVFVGNLIDREDYTSTVVDWNSSLSVTLSGLDGYHTKIHPVDLYSAIGPYSAVNYASGDKTHLNTTGYNTLMAPAWYAVFNAVSQT